MVHGGLGTAPTRRCHHALYGLFRGGVAVFSIVLGDVVAQTLGQGCEFEDDMHCLAASMRGQQ